MKNMNEYITYNEIIQQPRLWKETWDIINKEKDHIESFFKKRAQKNVNVVLTGAGSSAYIGNILKPYLKEMSGVSIESIPTTDIVSRPEAYFDSDKDYVLVSFARSGNSPESMATVQLVDNLVRSVHHIILTCNPEGKLAHYAEHSEQALMVLMPSDANDKGLAMTGSLSTMLLAALLIFNVNKLDNYQAIVETISATANELVHNTTINDIVNLPFKNIVYLGSNSMQGLAQEAELKMLELNGGLLTTKCETSLGFRHGPKSVINQDTLIISFLSNNHYVRSYEEDLLKEMYSESIATLAVIRPDDEPSKELWHHSIALPALLHLDHDIFSVFPYLMTAQLLAFKKSYSNGINPDNPSPNGIINRVVKGVAIYPYSRVKKKKIYE